MNELMKFDDVNKRIITIRNQAVLLDSDVAAIYGVETKRVNEAIRNNPKKFPEGYVFQLNINEFNEVKALIEISQKIDNQNAIESFDSLMTINKLSNYVPKAFTEKGLYMLATILKSDQAIDATIGIVETFAKLKQLQSNLATLEAMEPEILETEVVEKVVEKTGGLFEELFFTGTSTSAKTSIGVNLGIISLKREITAEKNPPRPSNSEFDELKTMIEELKEQNKQLLKKH